jgi:hypothetical protein
MTPIARNRLPRAGSAVLLGVLFGTWVHHDYVRWQHLGRSAFLSHQAVRFDKYVAVAPAELLLVFRYAILALGVWVCYQMLASGLAKLMPQD